MEKDNIIKSAQEGVVYLQILKDNKEVYVRGLQYLANTKVKGTLTNDKIEKRNKIWRAGTANIKEYEKEIERVEGLLKENPIFKGVENTEEQVQESVNQ